MAKMDHDFVRALKHGCHPQADWGSDDRLTDVAYEHASIREVILFPLLRPET